MCCASTAKATSTLKAWMNCSTAACPTCSKGGGTTMAYKRQIDRLPIIPADAKEFNVTCHYCIVGCGYKAYTWPTNKQGGIAADQNKFGVDLSKQQAAETPAWYAPSMYNIVRQ